MIKKVIHTDEELRAAIRELKPVKGLNRLVATPAPEYEQCDFCSSKPVLWDYPVLSFRTFVGMDDDGCARFCESIGHWGACQACYELVEAKKREELFDRMMTQLDYHQPGVNLRDTPMYRQLLGFFMHQQGKAEYIHKGERQQ